ncbi:hydrolase or acyltransferase (alpha beta hydrolase superfamily) [Fusarium pseudoanthophilum]|uniref:Hydrolase or acyltransferase (Alpha beta hydrolase superfamily) n=1 Tax=Fusarium pseudoanthophilum TaxID=48495 RepID=A0A8H5PMR3_9HYPO|nr:hydrolase or acyltransferase (alpha beta hydrolase superfamily) [Fusarium pseudoanthophilum]
MKSTSLFSSLLLGATIASSSIIPRDSAPSSSPKEPGDPIILLSKDESFHFELLFTLGITVFGAGDVNDILAAAKHIKPGNFTSWLETFQTLAEYTKGQAEDPDNAYDPLNVREAWFAASSYYRQADFYNHANWTDPRINSFWLEQRAAFDKALAALPVPGERIQIPTDNYTIEAIWYTNPATDAVKRPTLVIGNGYDASQEDSYHSFVVPALARGWNVMTYEGPGQPTIRRNDDIGFIPDWEKVLTPVIDELLNRKGCFVDEDKLVLVGISMGGYLAARAAAFEPRIKALILNGGVWDVYEGFSSQLGPDMKELFDAGKQDEFDEAASSLFGSPQVPTTVRWGLEHGLWCFKQHSPYLWLQSLKQYTLKDVVDKINVPVLVVDSEFEGFFAGQPGVVRDALGDRATYKFFNGTAGYHVQVGAGQEWNRYQFSWLHKVLG